MKRILIIASNFMDLKISSNNRTNYLPQFLHDNGYDVEVITTNFNHHRKEHVKKTEDRDYGMTLLNEKGYTKNVSFKRLISINSYKRSLKKYLRNMRKVDIVYVFVPPHPIAQVAYRYAKRVGAKFVIDVRDLWPEAFKILIKNDIIYSILFSPFIFQANKTYRLADYIISVSETYENRALLRQKKKYNSSVIYLGTSFSEYDKYVLNKIHKKNKNEFRVVYAGTLGNSYDIKSLLKAAKLINDAGYKNISFHILGSGPLEKKLLKLNAFYNSHAVFHGRLPYSEMVSFLSTADVVVNLLVGRAPQSIINKHMDYAASGKPVISTQETPEYINLLRKYDAGVSIKNGDVEKIKSSIIYLANNPEITKKMGKNHRRMGEELFDRDIIYSKVIDIIESI